MRFPPPSPIIYQVICGALPSILNRESKTVQIVHVLYMYMFVHGLFCYGICWRLSFSVSLTWSLFSTLSCYLSQIFQFTFSSLTFFPFFPSSSSSNFPNLNFSSSPFSLSHSSLHYSFTFPLSLFQVPKVCSLSIFPSFLS